jgi:hypothetical protein
VKQKEKLADVAARPFSTRKLGGRFVARLTNRQNIWVSQVMETVIGLFRQACHTLHMEKATFSIRSVSFSSFIRKEGSRISCLFLLY